MSSIRLYILDALVRHGELHGHQLRLLAEQEHVSLWTDFSVGSLYGAIKRLDADGLIAAVRTERAGNFPERQVYDITDAGRTDLARIRHHGLTTVHLKPDPFDLAVTRLDLDRLDDLPEILADRRRALEGLLTEATGHHARASRYLSVVEDLALRHRAVRVRAELDWLDTLIDALPAIVADERERALHPDFDKDSHA